MLSQEIINRHDFIVKKGYHPKDSLMIVLDGSFNCTISEENYQVCKNDIFVFNKNSYFERYVVEPISCIYIQFDRFPFPIKDGLLQIKDEVRTMSTISYLEYAIREKDQILTKHFTNDILLTYKHNNAAASIYNDEIVSFCISFLEKNYQSSITLSTLANEFHISKQWLILKFKKSINKTPLDFLNEIRIHHGKNFLINSDYTINDIAEKCGFNNIYYFSNFFKKHTGMRPSEFRKSFKL